MSVSNRPETGSVAIVVQRWHPEIAGGSEHLAFQFARLLRERYPVELLTTTALDSGTWANELEPGLSETLGVRVRRFPVTRGRDAYWYKLHELLVRSHHARRSEPETADPETYFGDPPSEAERFIPWAVPLQEEWLRRQGPHSAPLLDWLRREGRSYRAILFVTYLYSPSYFGSLQTDPARSFLVSTLHDEPPAYLSIFRRMAGRFRAHFWLTEAERDLSRRLWGQLPGRVIPAWIDEPPASNETPADSGVPFLLYSGRMDPGKGVDRLCEFFIRFKGEYGRPLDLVLTGNVAMKIPRREDILTRGFVSDAEKWELMGGAAVFVMPSPLESLSIVTLEAMAAGTPVLVNGENPVLREHIRKGDGRAYFDYSSFAAELTALLEDGGLRERIADGGKQYVRDTYGKDRVAEALFEEIEKARLE